MTGPSERKPVVRGAAGDDGWRPWGLPMAVGMALHAVDQGRTGDGLTPNQYADQERRYPDNLFIQNAREADFWTAFHYAAMCPPCHDRPWRFVQMSGAYGRGPAIPRWHALESMNGEW